MKLSMIALTSFRTHPRFHPYPPYLQVSVKANQNRMSYADGKVKQRHFSAIKGMQQKMNDPI